MHSARVCVCVCVEYMCVCASVCKVGVCLPGGYGDNAAIKNSSLSAGVSGRREGRWGEVSVAPQEHAEDDSLHQQDRLFMMASVSRYMIKDFLLLTFCTFFFFAYSFYFLSLTSLFNSKKHVRSQLVSDAHRQHGRVFLHNFYSSFMPTFTGMHYSADITSSSVLLSLKKKKPLQIQMYTTCLAERNIT